MATLIVLDRFDVTQYTLSQHCLLFYPFIKLYVFNKSSKLE